MVSQHLAVDDRSGLLELLKEVVVSDISRQVADEDTCCFAKLSLRFDVAPSKGLVTIRGPVNYCSRIAQALIIRKANLSVDLLVKVDKKDFGGIEGKVDQDLLQTLFSRSLR